MILRPVPECRRPRLVRGVARLFGARLGRHWASMVALLRRPDQKIRGKIRRVPVYLLLERVFSLERRFRNSQFMRYSTGSDGMDGEGVRDL